MTSIEPIAFSRPFYSDDAADRVAEVIRSRWIVGGPKLAEFEKRIAEHCRSPHAIGTSSWTTAAFLVLHAWGIGAGDEVIVPSLTFIASVNAIVHAGATPVFVDIDPETFNIDANAIEAAITPRTRCIMPVDQLGLPCDIDKINTIAAGRELLVLEDAACAFGSQNQGRPVGSLCPMTIFSLHARKVLTTGEGGMIVTADGDLSKRLKRLRHQGMSLSDFARHGAAPTTFEDYPEIGYNFRITDLQAALGLAQMDQIDDILERRAAVATKYNTRLADHPLLIAPYIPTGMTPNWQSYMVSLRPDVPYTRNQIMDRLFELDIPTRRGVMASHREPPYRGIDVNLPNTEYVADHTLQLPMHPGLTGQQVDYILESIDTLI